jgi:DNA-binding NarL/FixJ family response regulator
VARDSTLFGVFGRRIDRERHMLAGMSKVGTERQSRPRYLVIEDSEAYGRSLQRVLGRWGDATIVRSAREGRVAIRTRAWSAIVLDLRLPDGSGLDVLEGLRAIRPATPVLVLTGDNDPEAINRACELGASFAVKPVTSSLLQAFVESATSLRERLVSAAHGWRARDGLSEAECDVLVRLALGETREEIAAGRGTSIHTVKKQCEKISKKTGGLRFHAAAARLVREVAGA